MSHSSHVPEDYIAWVQRINNRWIVHEGLNHQANAYMDYLAAIDPLRLEASCRIAHIMTHQKIGHDDPKPRFYGGLFSLATPEEAQRFLAAHWFISHIIPAGSQDPTDALNIAPTTLRQIAKLKAEVEKVVSQKKTS